MTIDCAEAFVTGSGNTGIILGGGPGAGTVGGLYEPVGLGRAGEPSVNGKYWRLWIIDSGSGDSIALCMAEVLPTRLVIQL